MPKASMKIPALLGLLAAFFLSGWAAGAALADPAQNSDDFVKRLMGGTPGKGKTFACFNRVYDEPHLASHPRQNVRAMSLLVVVDAENPDSYNLRIGVNFRNRKHFFETSGDCGNPHTEGAAGGAYTAHCGVACDGGAIDVALKDNGSVLLTIPDGARVWRPGAEDNDTVHGAFGEDDKLFRVDRVDLAQCAALGTDKGERAALTRGK
jgi:hypothetical protein